MDVCPPEDADTMTGDMEEEAAAATGRQHRILRLQQMLGFTSSNPFTDQNTALVSAASGSGGSSVTGSHQDADLHVSAAATDVTDGPQRQDRADVDSPRTNPFYQYYLESRRGQEAETSEDAGLDSVFVPRPQDDPFPSFGPSRVEKASASLQPSQDLFNSSRPWRSSDSDPVRDEGRGFLRARGGGAEEVNLCENPFKSAAPEPDFLLQTSQPEVENPFGWGSSDPPPAVGGDLPHEDPFHVFSSPASDTVDLFSSPVARTLFQDVSGLDNPFGTTPLNLVDPFQEVSHVTPDIFFPRPPEAGVSTPDLFKVTPSGKLHDIAVTTPQGTKHGILQPTPFSQAGGLTPGAAAADATHVQTFKRPPKPLPRTQRKEKPPVPERPPQPALLAALKPIQPEPPVPKRSPKLALRPLPVIPRRQKTPEMKPVTPNNYVVFEDILLIGQEHCVEDWPEDSPELNPGFRPSGKLRLRRESLKLNMDSAGGSGEEQDSGSGNQSKKKEKKFRMSFLSRRGSKDKFPDDTREGKSRTLPVPRRSSKEYSSDVHVAAAEDEQDELDYRKKPAKTKVSRLLRRSSTTSTVREGKSCNSPYETKGAVLGDSEAEDGGQAQHEKRKNKMKIKFVPQRGFSITREKRDEEVKGAAGYTSQKGSEDTSTGDRNFQDACDVATRQEDDFYPFDCKPKNPAKLKALHKGGRSSKENDDLGSQRRKSSCSAEDDLYRMECSKQGDLADDEFPGEMHYSRQHLDHASKTKKLVKLGGFKKHKAKSDVRPLEWDDPPGATSVDFLSEAAQAEWLAAQQDERAMAGFQDEDEDGDTDSLMEWWNTVEQWDELPSDDENNVKQKDESKSFSILADKVQRGLRVFNKVFTERAEVLWQSIIMLHAITDDINMYHKKAKAAGITTTAVGGVTAIAGLALAPFTFGASLIITAVGVGVATAGGITSASVAISDNNSNNMHDRKKVEIALKDYEGHLLDIGKILHFIDKGLYKLRGHPFLRSGTQHYSADWETRRAVQIISLADAPVMRATEVTDGAIASLQGLFRGMDKYFVTDSRELKKGCRKEVVAQIKEVANVLNVAVVELNAIREELQEVTGEV